MQRKNDIMEIFSMKDETNVILIFLLTWWNKCHSYISLNKYVEILIYIQSVLHGKSAQFLIWWDDFLDNNIDRLGKLTYYSYPLTWKQVKDFFNVWSVRILGW
jgi:hypothetical protein